jgi:hypothetical protein
VGLDAVVYRNIKNFQLGPDEQHARALPKTGEVYFDDDRLERKYFRRRDAVAYRLGNITAISILREEVSQLIGPDSFVERKVLYSGTHCGDFIPLDELDKLATDLHRIHETGRSSALMQEFLTAMEHLIRAAKEEGNPIVF